MTLESKDDKKKTAKQKNILSKNESSKQKTPNSNNITDKTKKEEHKSPLYKPTIKALHQEFRVGDYVARLSHNRDVMFKIEQITPQEVLLKGVDLRLYADAPQEDLVLLSRSEIASFQEKYVRRSAEMLEDIQRSRACVIDGFLSRAKINYKNPPQSPQGTTK